MRQNPPRSGLVASAALGAGVEAIGADESGAGMPPAARSSTIARSCDTSLRSVLRSTNATLSARVVRLSPAMLSTHADTVARDALLQQPSSARAISRAVSY